MKDSYADAHAVPGSVFLADNGVRIVLGSDGQFYVFPEEGPYLVAGYELGEDGRVVTLPMEDNEVVMHIDSNGSLVIPAQGPMNGELVLRPEQSTEQQIAQSAFVPVPGGSPAAAAGGEGLALTNCGPGTGVKCGPPPYGFSRCDDPGVKCGPSSEIYTSCGPGTGFKCGPSSSEYVRCGTRTTVSCGSDTIARCGGSTGVKCGPSASQSYGRNWRMEYAEEQRRANDLLQRTEYLVTRSCGGSTGVKCGPPQGAGYGQSAGSGKVCSNGSSSNCRGQAFWTGCEVYPGRYGRCTPGIAGPGNACRCD